MDDSKSRQAEIVSVLFKLCFEMKKLRDDPARLNDLLDVAARYAWALYFELSRAGMKVLPGADIVKQRAPLGPEDPGFFHCLETLEEFTALAADALPPPR